MRLSGPTSGRRIRRSSKLAVLFAVLAGGPGAWTHAQGDPPQTRTVVVAERYAGKSGFHRFFLGNDYRAVWATPVKVEVLDLAREAGGLVPVRRVGGQQTKALALRDAKGVGYTFRGLTKDASHILDADLRGTVAEKILQDLMAAQHPASEVVAHGLLEAAGVPSPGWRLVVLPDDASLGEFRKEFAGEVGVFAPYPSAATPTTPGYLGATEILHHLEMYKRLESVKGTAIDAHALLKARLVDVLMGDWDRHRGQWRWARIPGETAWQPLPEDRDQAFSRYEGYALDRARSRDPRFQEFGPRYAGIGGITYNGWEQDRRLLVSLTRQDFADAAAALHGTLTNEVIEKAVRAMPAEWFAVDGARLVADLQKRRDALPEISTKYYEHLAQRVDVYMTDEPERVLARRAENGDLEVTVATVAADGGVAAPYYQRTFRRAETEEVRFYALAGNDTLSLTGAPGGIKVRMIGGPGNDMLDATGAGNAKLSDSAGDDQARNAGFDARPYERPAPPRNAPWIPPRDFTHETWTSPWVAYSGDLGVFVGMGVHTERYSFRKTPVGSEHRVRAGYSFGEEGGRLDYRGDFYRENRHSYFSLSSYLSSAEVLRFYDLGNETPNDGNEDLHRVSADQVVLYPSMSFRFPKRTTFTIGPAFKYTNTDDSKTDQLVNQVKPYGVGGFGELGLHAVISVDGTDSALFPRKGVRVSLRGSLVPEALDVESTFGQMGGDFSAYLSAGDRVTLALRAGGKKVFGDYPFFDAASIGGGGLDRGALEEPSQTVRGFRSRRFMGDASLYGNADLRLRVSRVTIVLPGAWGLLGFVDSGRVYVSGEDSDAWHTGVGGGLWLSLLKDRLLVSATLAHSDEDDLFYFKGGFSF